VKPTPIHVCCNEDLGTGHGGGEWDEEKIGDDGEVVEVGRLDGLDFLLLGGFTGKLDCTRGYLIISKCQHFQR
jgi:hypothetical protein